MSKPTIYDELASATGLPYEPEKVKPEVYIVRLCNSLAEMEDEIYDKLSREAQEYGDKQVKNQKTKVPLELPPGAPEAPADNPTDTKENTDVKASKKKASKKKVTGKKATTPATTKKPEVAKKTATTPAVKKETGPRKVSTTNLICEAVCKNPEISSTDLLEQFKKKGIEINPGHLRAIYYDTIRAIMYLKKLGKLKD